VTLPLRVGVLGATGRMGRLVLAELLDEPGVAVGAAAARRTGDDIGLLAGRGPAGVTTGPVADLAACDVVIDFSLPEALAAALPALAGVPLVTGTTGLPAAVQAAVDAHAATAPVVQAANFSLGVNLLLDLVRRAAAAWPEGDVEIVETHHRHKRDAPSGTALALGAAVERARGPLAAAHGREGLVGPRPPGEIGFHALRGGDVVGEHTVWLLGDGERVSLAHGATSRRTFARGALRAARWVHGRSPGRSGMADVLGLSPG
jgi:4-hydroxy-tetrahydrodipicolinate reductase